MSYFYYHTEENSLLIEIKAEYFQKSKSKSLLRVDELGVYLFQYQRNLQEQKRDQKLNAQLSKK